MSIVNTTETCSGMPRIDGSRLVVSTIVGAICDGDFSFSELLEGWNFGYVKEIEREITTDDFFDALKYCADLTCLKRQAENYCNYCVFMYIKDYFGSISPEFDTNNTENRKLFNNIHQENHGFSFEYWSMAKKYLKEN